MAMMMMIRYYPSTIIIIGLLLLVTSSCLIVNINAQSTCNINGVTYDAGETVQLTDDPNENRCGPSYECVCNPTAFQQLDCPFCSFATKIPNLLRCANDGEIVEFRDTNNIGQICSCDASNPSNPISSCTQSSTAGLTCDITIPTQDGVRTITYNDGDIVGIESICGATSDFPCYCNPNLPTQIECPYCMITNPFAGTVCAEVGKTVNVIDSQGIDVQACTCEDSYSLAFPKLFNCNAAPTFAPIEPGAQCTNLIDETTNETFTVDHGTNLGSRITSEFCGPPSEYPCYCDVRLPNQVDCPYCAADDGDGGYICGVHNEVLENVPQTDGTTTRDCLCLKPTPGSDPEIVCGDFTLAPTETPVECVIDDQSFEPGQSIPTSVVPADGPCGSGFQYVCNPDLDDDDGTTNNLEYPYCEHTTNTGSTVCARNGQSVTFTNESNDDVTCDCSYTTSGGPNPTCGPKATTSPTISVAPSQSPSVPPPTPNVNTAGNSGATKTTTTTFMIGYVIMMGWIFVLL